MTTPEREILAFIELNRQVARGTIRDHFPQWNIESILRRLESTGYVNLTIRPTTHGQQDFYSIKETPR
jgi:hypothetical protein